MLDICTKNHGERDGDVQVLVLDDERRKFDIVIHLKRMNDRKQLPVRAARVNARVKIGRVVKKKAAKQKYYWVTGRCEINGVNRTRASVLAVGARTALTYSALAAPLFAIDKANSQHAEIGGIFAVEITAADYERLDKYDYISVTEDGCQAFVFPLSK